jgi:HEAT repeat protein
MVSTMLPNGSVNASRAEVHAAASAALEGLRDPDARVRAEAVHAAWMVVMASGNPPEKAEFSPIVPPLVERLGDEDASVRLAAIRGVGYLGPMVAAEPPAALVARLDDSSEPNRDAAAIALAAYNGGLAGVLPSIVHSLETGSPEYRKAVIKLLGQIHGAQLPADVLSGLVAAVRSRDSEVVQLAVAKLSELGEKAGGAVPDLGRELDQLLRSRGQAPKSADQSDGYKIRAIVDCLGKIVEGTSNQKEAVAALAEALRPDRDPALRLAAARTLGRFHRDPAVFAALQEYILDRDSVVRHGVIWSIHDLDFAEGYTVPKALATALEDASAETRADAVAAIGHSGTGVDAFVPALVQHLLYDPDREVRSMCATVIHVLHPPKITAASAPYLIKGLESPEPAWRGHVLDGLQSLRQAGQAAVPAVIRLLKEPHDPRTDGYCHAQAAFTLGRIAPGSPQADAAVAALVEFLESQPDDVSTKWTLEALTAQWTIEALAAFGSRASAAIPKIRELQQHKDENVRKAAAAALAKIHPAQ